MAVSRPSRSVDFAYLSDRYWEKRTLSKGEGQIARFGLL